MFSRRSYSPASSIYGMSKAKSSTHFFKQAKQLSYHHKPSIYNDSTQECLACKHERQSQLKDFKGTSRVKQDTNNASQYYGDADKDMKNLRSSKRFLQQLLQKNKTEYKNSLQAYASRIHKAATNLQLKNQTILDLQKQLQQHSQTYMGGSIVKSYVNGNSQENERRERKITQLTKNIAFLNGEKHRLQEENSELNRRLLQVDAMQRKIAETEKYAREYESMKILINKLEEDREGLINKFNIQLKEMEQQHENQIEQYFIKCEELQMQVNNHRTRTHSTHHSNCPSSNNNSAMECNKLKELYEQRFKECENLNSRIACVESQLTFITNKFKHLLKSASEEPITRFIRADNQIEEYRIQRVGRYNASIGKDSLISMNLSPIKQQK